MAKKRRVRRVLSDRELEEGRWMWKQKDHHPGDLGFLVALALDTVFVERKKSIMLQKRLERIEKIARAALSE